MPKENDEQTDTGARQGQKGDNFLPTGVPHLDELLDGGLGHRTLTLVMGLPGSGKTTLASQIVFSAARSGKQALILSALSESTSKLVDHLRTYTFFDPQLIGGRVQILSLQSVFDQGLEAITKLILEESQRVHAEVVLLDGFRGIPGIDGNPYAARALLYQLATAFATLKTMTLITSEIDPRDPAYYPETTTADVILGLHYSLDGVRHHRGIEVIKARGVAALPGLHTLTLDSEGAHVYPQLETRVVRRISESRARADTGAAADGAPTHAANLPVIERAPFGHPELDTMLSGGLPQNTSTLLAGSLGSGKTLLALYYAMAGVNAGENVVYLGFRESRHQLLLAAAGFDFGPALARALDGPLHLLLTPPIMVNPDILAHKLTTTLERVGAYRLVIDSIAELERGLAHSGDPGRVEDYLAALLLALRERGVTSLMLKETDKAVATTLDFSSDPLSVLAENVILLQHVPYRGELHRILSILKLRFSGHDTHLREFRISAPRGLEVLPVSASGAGVLQGIAFDQNQEMTGGRHRMDAKRLRESPRD